MFSAHEGVLAARKGLELNLFKMSDFGVPYGEGPVLVTTRANAENAETKALLQKVLQAARKGYEFAVANTDAAAAILVEEAAKDGCVAAFPTLASMPLDMHLDSCIIHECEYQLRLFANEYEHMIVCVCVCVCVCAFLCATRSGPPRAPSVCYPI